VATGFLPDFKIFFDNNFLFFVTMTAGGQLIKKSRKIL
jgi:hypothetical protein